MRHSFATFCLLIGVAQAQELVVAPFLQSARPTSIWIAWETSFGDESVVEWGLDPALGRRSEGHSHAGFGFSRHHEVELTGLAPATRYFYRVRTGDLVGATHHFITPPSDDSEAPTRLVAMSDMQRDGRYPDVFAELVDEGVIPAAREQFGDDLAQALSLALVPGDLVENGLFYGQWAEQFFNPAAALLRHVPVYPVLGNHEVNTQFYFDYFHLPDNGTAGFEEHWWWFDHSNVRIIGLDSNFGFQLPIQLEWLDGVLADACAADHVDFVFAQLHHPFHSELWPAGNTDYTGDVIERLEGFSTDCAKPSVHFYGHTHGYSRGQSRDHQHVMVNVATAGGSIDRWGEFPQTDYPEHTVSQDEYGFVFVEVLAGDDPLFRLQRLGRGQPNAPADNPLRDEVLIRAHNTPPEAPTPRGALGDQVNPACFTLASRAFVDDDGDGHQATRWQVAPDCDFEALRVDRWRQSENWFREVDSQADDDLSDEVIEGLEPNTAYCWRARHRDTGLVWSGWSEPEPFRTADDLVVPLPLLNPGAEEGVAHWEVEQGILESVNDGECAGGDAFAGARHFAVGGVCESVALAVASQRVDVTDHAVMIDAGEQGVRFGGQLRDWNGSDRPDLWLRFLDGDDALIGETEPVGTQSDAWTEVVDQAAVPPGTRALVLVLRGTRNAGTDNDSYFDELFVALTAGALACDPAPEAAPDVAPDLGVVDAGELDAGVRDVDVQNPDVQDVDVQNVDAQDVDAQNVDTPDVQDVEIPDVQNVDVQNMDTPDVQNVDTPDVQNMDTPDVQNVDVQNVDTPDVQNPDVQIVDADGGEPGAAGAPAGGCHTAGGHAPTWLLVLALLCACVRRRAFLLALALAHFGCDDGAGAGSADAELTADATRLDAAELDAAHPTDASAAGDAAASRDAGAADAATDAVADAAGPSAFAAPQPWARPIEDYLEAGDAQDYESFLRGVHDLAVFEDRLYLVYGDATQNLGRVTDIDIRAFADPDDPTATVAHTSREEHLDGFRWVDDSLVLPGIDAVDDAWLGNVYVKRPGEDWVMRRTVPNGVHVHDVAWWAGSLWAVGSGGTQAEWGLGNVYAHLWRSRDWGETFTIEKREHNRRRGDIRWTRMLAAGDLYLFGYRTDAMGTIDALLSFRYDGAVPWPVEGLLAGVFVERTEPLGDDRGLVVGLDTAAEPRAQGVWVLADDEATPLEHFAGRRLVDVVRDGDGWLVLTHEGDAWAAVPDPWLGAVWSTTDFASFEPVLDFAAEHPLSALAAWRGHLFFGDTSGGVLRAARR